MADFMPERYDGASLGRLLAENLGGEGAGRTKVLIARSSLGGEEILKELRENDSIEYTDLVIYETVIEEGCSGALRSCIEEREFTKAVFTSSSTVEGFCRMAGEGSLEGICAVCIGEKTRQAAETRGMRTVTALNAGVDELVACICNQGMGGGVRKVN